MHSAPKGTILGLISVESMSLYFTGKKSNLTGLCEIWNNFDLKISEHSPKSNSFHVNERQTSCVTMKSHKKMDKYTIQSMWSQDTFAWPSICMTSREVFSGDSRAFKNCAE